jgi:hypothetical protein
MQFVRYGALALLLFLSLPARAIDDGSGPAAQDFDENEDSPTYSGASIVRASTEFENLKDAVNLNFVIGFRIPTLRWLAVELDLGSTIIPGENTGQATCTESGGGGGGGLLPIGGGGGDGGVVCEDGSRFTRSRNDLQMNSAAIYATARSTGQFFVSGKLGYSFVNSSIEELEENQSGTAYAGGVGYRWNPKSLSGVEFNYTKVNDEIDFLGLQFNYGFGRRD